jgi:hypothetical protein
MAITDIDISEKLTAGAPPIKYEGDMRPTNDQGIQMAGPAGYHRLLEHFLNLGYPYEQAGDLAMQAWRSGDLAPSDQEYEPKAFGGIAGLDGRRRYFLGSIKKLFKKVTKPIKKVAKKLTSSKLAKLAALAAATYYGGGGKLFGMQRAGMDKFTLDNLWKGGWKSIGPERKGYAIRSGGLSDLISKFPGGAWGLAGTAAASTPFLMGDQQDTLEEASGEVSRGKGLDLAGINKEVIDAYRSGDDAVKNLAYKYPYLVDREYIDIDRLPLGAAQGGRIGYDTGGDVEEQLMEAVAKKFPNLNADEYTLEDLITLLQISGTMNTEGADILDKAAGLNMITPQSISRSAQAVSRHRDYIAQGGRIGYADKGFVDKIPKVDTENILKNLEDLRKKKKKYDDAIFESERIDAQEGGLMDLGGMEKDYRNEGGFVPIGGQEKADDVPARLSRNEFVFTADAVRNAGGGDIDKGAEIMENVMKNLEAGGEISEESQGREGAKEMFATSERLSEII